MMRLVLVGTVAAVLSAGAAFAQSGAGTMLGTVHLTHTVLADGKPLAAGTYQVRLTTDEPKPGVGQDPTAEKYVEFLKGGKVAGREVASVIGPEDIGQDRERQEAPRQQLVGRGAQGRRLRPRVDQQGRHELSNQHAAAGEAEGVTRAGWAGWASTAVGNVARCPGPPCRPCRPCQPGLPCPPRPAQPARLALVTLPSNRTRWCSRTSGLTVTSLPSDCFRSRSTAFSSSFSARAISGFTRSSRRWPSGRARYPPPRSGSS